MSRKDIEERKEEYTVGEISLKKKRDNGKREEKKETERQIKQ